MFRIELDRFNGMLCNEGWGFWTTDTVMAFLAAEQEAILDLGVPLNELLILFDASKFLVQDQKVISLLRNPANPLYNAKRGAFVTPSGLGMMQIKRGNPQPNIGIFNTTSEARQFLLSE